MTTEQTWQLATAAACVLALVALVLAVRAGARAARAERRVRDLDARVAVQSASSPASTPAAAPAEVPHEQAATYVITGLASDEHEAPVPVARDIDGRLFADIVARETVVKAAAWTHGVRRALSPASRNRIRFEARQETRRAGRERRAEMKQALREFRARGRAGLGEDVA